MMSLLILFYASVPVWVGQETKILKVCNVETREICEVDANTGELIKCTNELCE